MQYVFFLIAIICAYLYGVRMGKRAIVKILKIPKGREIARITYRPAKPVKRNATDEPKVLE